MVKNNGGEIVRRVEVKDGRRWKATVVKISGFSGDTQRGVALLTMSLTHTYGQRGWRWIKTGK